MWKCVVDFVDLRDNRREYKVGDIYPHPDSQINITDKQLKELSEDTKKRPALIEAVLDTGKKPKAKEEAKEATEEIKEEAKEEPKKTRSPKK